ncbi:hypothetical protein EPA93_43405 [Ktedonosporobacter rubrisoli]|uniref:Uncharacterized protein n=1 Tax=Ktedonosporobacter rubrisoli TaxID=2509675 RepID=A0A4P6K3H7_KTERU|nr:hypothetical protein [Ktedonosporobacter rubrisoli]QBD82463.1 hypothetical protein EPA93_43405 [Ktedonosporobacter rubrisoli]
MRQRVAHRPHYRTMRQFFCPPSHAQRKFFHTRWMYRRQQLHYEKHPLGYGLSLIPLPTSLLRQRWL